MSAPDTQPIVEVLTRHPTVRMAILFGSTARGSAGPSSDIDLAVEADQPLDADQRMAIMSALAEATGRPIDLVDLRTAGEPLVGQIVTHGKQILGDRQRFARLLSQHLFDEADFLPYRNRILRERRTAWIGK